jgi:dolichol-phosphate mannosyltransferase
MGRLLLSWLANAYARAVTGLRLNDLTDLDGIHSTGYAFQIETVFRADRAGFRLVEIPIVFVDRNVGSSKMNRAIVWEAIWMVWRMRLWRVTLVPEDVGWGQ